jgi:hypothetical protein
MGNVIVVIGPGQIGQSIARRVGVRRARGGPETPPTAATTMRLTPR